MNSEPLALLVAGVLVGVAGTVTMDLLARAGHRFKMPAGGHPAWIGRWYLGFPQGKFSYQDITIVPERPGEVRVALVGHYLIGSVLGIVYVFGARAIGLVPGSFVPAVVYGIATNVFPWLLMFPALGFGFFGLRSPPGRNLFAASFANHVYYGLGLWWAALLLGLG